MYKGSGWVEPEAIASSFLTEVYLWELVLIMSTIEGGKHILSDHIH